MAAMKRARRCRNRLHENSMQNGVIEHGIKTAGNIVHYNNIWQAAQAPVWQRGCAIGAASFYNLLSRFEKANLQ